MDRFPPIWVMWLDSNSLTSGWHRERVFDEQATTVGMKHESIGFLLGENDDCILIAQNHGLERDNEGEVNVSEVTQIPKCAILFRQSFTVPSRIKRLERAVDE